jgi:hypothetical protein
MAVAIVNALEVVDIQHGQTERPPLALTGQLPLCHRLVKHSPVGQPGQHIGTGHLLDAPLQRLGKILAA